MFSFSFRNNRFALLLLSALMCQSPLLFSHAVITETSLNEKPMKPQTAAQLMLQFNSEIEPTLSKVILVSKGDNKEAIHFNMGSKPGQIIVQIPPLSEGNYALNYKVYAADGHLTEDILRFSVAPVGK